MGVPKFYRWLSERYPLINQLISDATLLPEFDNLYLDMNGIIHACSHPNDDDTTALSNREIMLAIFRYIDRIVTEIVKPKKVLFMAIDGVAPRAKLNQQRARRFRAAQDRLDRIAKAKDKGEIIDDHSLFDSNCITPGTDFMDEVGKHIRWFIRKKIRDDPLWKNLEVTFSGHDVPGEGEHKIMQFIRDSRSQANYAPNQRHCMYGQDADLIMLGLSTHEPHFTLLREVIDFGGGKRTTSTRQTIIRQTKDAQFQLLHLSVLREYIELDFGLGEVGLERERLIDDFVFLTFLVGNDFLPHLPTLDIGEHAFDVIFDAYRQVISEKETDKYIVKYGEISDMAQLERLFTIIGSQELSILSDREEEQKAFNSKRKKGKQVVEEVEDAEEAEEALQKAFEDAFQEMSMATPTQQEVATEEAKESAVSKDYRGRYYFDKFKVLPKTAAFDTFMGDLRRSYLEGLMWCLAYYVKGCISWTWFYPYHYGPMLQDMLHMTTVASTISFSLGQPFRPFQQLLGCLPPASTTLVPKPYAWLMTNRESPLIEFYPNEFAIDADGKKNPWEAVVKLPFIDEKALMAAEATHCPMSKLTLDERKRNSFGKILFYVFNPSVTETYFSCNPEIGLPDVTKCQSSVVEMEMNIAPGHYFTPVLVPGTTCPYAGFPCLGVMSFSKVETDYLRVNVFGSDSKYKSLVLEMESVAVDLDAVGGIVNQLLGSSVYVNYPLIHEAKVVAVTNATDEYRLSATGEVVKSTHDAVTANKWAKDSVAEGTKYAKGRGIPGTGGIVIGDVHIRLRVCPLQGIRRDTLRGSTHKVFGTTEADIPIQMALWKPPVEDARFIEVSNVSIESLMPLGATVIPILGKFIGAKGSVTNYGVNPMTGRVDEVEVEFDVIPEEAPFGYSLALSITEEYFSVREVCQALQIQPSILGKVVGSIFVETADRHDLGLNFKRNGMYQLLGYSRCINTEVTAKADEPSAWSTGDAVKIVGTADAETKVAEAETFIWEYTAKAIAVIADYKSRFPLLFENLQKLPHQPRYNPKELLGTNYATDLDGIMGWMKTEGILSIPRTPLTTTMLCKDALKAIERAADKYATFLATYPVTKTKERIRVEYLICGNNAFNASDAPLNVNKSAPRLGDRVVNLTSIGVPFGLKGTVVGIHSHTGYIDVLFDEEFIGGRSLQGMCSQFRGRLLPWSSVLLTSAYPSKFEFASTNVSVRVEKVTKKEKATSASPTPVSGVAKPAPKKEKAASVSPTPVAEQPAIAVKPVNVADLLLSKVSKSVPKQVTPNTAPIVQTIPVESSPAPAPATGKTLNEQSKKVLAILKKDVPRIPEPTNPSAAKAGTNITQMLKSKFAAESKAEQDAKIDETIESLAAAKGAVTTDEVKSVISLLKRELNIPAKEEPAVVPQAAVKANPISYAGAVQENLPVPPSVAQAIVVSAEDAEMKKKLVARLQKLVKPQKSDTAQPPEIKASEAEAPAASAAKVQLLSVLKGNGTAPATDASPTLPKTEEVATPVLPEAVTDYALASIVNATAAPKKMIPTAVMMRSKPVKKAIA